MQKEELLTMARKEGVSVDDADLLFRHGVTPSLIEQAAKLPITLKDIAELFNTHGPGVVIVLTELVQRASRNRK